VIHEKDFKISRRPYAVDMESLRIGEHESKAAPGTYFYPGRITAVWFRRSKGVLKACIGELWDLQDVRPIDGWAFLAAHRDGRYGGDCEGRWDGTGYWGSELPEVRDAHLEILRPMLENYPQVPPGYDGWWRFETRKELYA
jgi:hypothetical protein